jgi:hypothetical protein
MADQRVVHSLLDPGTAAKILETVSPTVVRDLLGICDPQ